MKAILVNPNDLSANGLSLGEAPKPEPTARQLLIKIAYTAINRADTLQRMGKYPVPAGESSVLGLECSGEVVAVAEGCQGAFKVGDKVMALLGGGGYAEYAVVDERSAMPSVVDLKTSAALPETWLTAYQLLHLVAHAKRGDHVLVHAAGSGVGLAAIQLITLLGGIPIATSRTAAKLTKCSEMGAVHVIDTSKGNWAGKVLEATGGKGADVILDPVGKAFAADNAKAVAVDGTWVSYGLMSGADVPGEGFLGVMLRKRATLVGSTLRSRTLEYKGELVAAFQRDCLKLLQEGKLRPVVDATFPLADAAQAHAHMEANANTGKILLHVASSL